MEGITSATCDAEVENRPRERGLMAVVYVYQKEGGYIRKGLLPLMMKSSPVDDMTRLAISGSVTTAVEVRLVRTQEYLLSWPGCKLPAGSLLDDQYHKMVAI
jgi:hypothetical protein